jgi:hypothetical protein
MRIRPQNEAVAFSESPILSCELHTTARPTDIRLSSMPICIAPPTSADIAESDGLAECPPATRYGSSITLLRIQQ